MVSWLLLASVPAGAQSVGGGGGGDRPSLVVAVSTHPRKAPPLPRLVPSQMTCNEFAEASARLKRFRIDYRGTLVDGFVVLEDVRVVKCFSPLARRLYPVRTLDREKCSVAYYCDDGSR